MRPDENEKLRMTRIRDRNYREIQVRSLTNKIDAHKKNLEAARRLREFEENLQ